MCEINGGGEEEKPSGQTSQIFVSLLQDPIISELSSQWCHVNSSSGYSSVCDQKIYHMYGFVVCQLALALWAKNSILLSIREHALLLLCDLITALVDWPGYEASLDVYWHNDVDPHQRGRVSKPLVSSMQLAVETRLRPLTMTLVIRKVCKRLRFHGIPWKIGTCAYNVYQALCWRDWVRG